MMRTVLTTLVSVALLFGAARVTAAQEWDVNRRQYTFIDTRLTIEVEVEAEGTLRLIRGMPGRLEVAGRALNGFTGFALGDRHGSSLRLSAVGADKVEYLVVVPERVYVRIELPDRRLSEVFGSTRNAATYIWDATVEERYEPRGEPKPGPEAEGRRTEPPAGAPVPAPDSARTDPGAGEGWAAQRARAGGAPAETPTPSLFTTYRQDVAPTSVSFPRTDLLRTLSVRLEGRRFRVAASRPLSLKPGDPAELEIRPASPPLDIVIGVPVGTMDFVVEVGGAPAFAIVEGRAVIMCDPAMKQVLGDGRQWFTFTPRDGRLECSASGADRARKGS